MTAGFLALGDSYTIGEGVEAQGTWPAQLVACLRADGYALAGPEIIATTGWTTDELAAAIAREAPAGSRTLVSLLIGVNNQYRGRDLAEFRVEFSGLLGTAIALAAGDARRVVCVSIPDWGVTPFAAAQGVDRVRVARGIDDFNAAAREIALAHAAAWVDITGLSRGDARDLLAADGLHPSAAQYAMWAAAIAPHARAALALPPPP